MFEQLRVGKASVDDQVQFAWVLPILLRIELVTEKVHPLESDLINVGGRQLSLITQQLILRCVARRTLGQRGLLKIDGNHAAQTVWLVNQCRELHKAHSQDKVDAEMRAERIASITHSGDHAASFAQDRIVHGHHQGLVWLEALLGAPADLGKKFVGVKALVRVKSVVSAPVLMKLPVSS